MGSRDLTAGVETPGEVFDTAVEISEDILNKMVANIKLALLILVIAVSYSSGSPAHHRFRRAPQEQATRLFTGNSAIDAGAAGAALGAAAHFIGRQILNPCRGGTRGSNSNTNTRFVNGETIQNGALGFLAGFAGSSLVSNALGNPCGK